MLFRFLLIIAISLYTGIASPAYAATHGSVNGTLELYSEVEGTLNFYYLDEMFVGHPFILQKGQKKIITVKKNILFMEASKKQTCFLAYAGEKLKVISNEKGVRFVSADSLRSIELDFFPELIAATGPFRFIVDNSPIRTEVTLNRRDSIIDSINHLRLAFYNGYINKHRISDYFNSYLQTAFRFRKLTDRLSLQYKGFNGTEVGDYYRAAIKNFLHEVTCDSCSDNMFYLEAIFNIYTTYYGKLKPEDAIDSINHVFIGNAKDFLIARLIKNELNNARQVSKAVTKGLNFIEDGAYKEMVSETIKEITTARPVDGKDTLFDLKGNARSFNDILGTYKGNVVYVDIWATWCGPCLRERPGYLSLAEKFKGQKVVFLSLSADKHQSEWFAMENILTNFPPNVHAYLFKGGNNAAFLKKYAVSTIPRYMIIDKNGKVVEPNSPRPSDKLIEDRLKSYLH